MQKMREVALGFGVLGALEVRRDGAPVPLPSGRRRAVLAALLVRAGHPVSTDALIEAAWGENLPADPRSALQTVLSRLRGALGVDQLRVQAAGYALHVDPDTLDAARFEALRARAAEAPAAEAAALLDEALALWRGPAYAEFADRDFARAEAVRLDELRLATVEDRARRCLEIGEAGSAVSALESLVAEHPLRERARELLMTALYQAGRPAEALERYRSYRALLVDQLGLDPSPALRNLEVRILSHDLPVTSPPRVGQSPTTRQRSGRPATAPPRLDNRPRAPSAWPVATTAFVGRDDDVAALLGAVTTHRLVTVTGPGGVGKTRLVTEALAAISNRLDVAVVVAELADVPAGQVTSAVAAALGLGAGTSPVHEAVVEYLSISTGVLVLDNCEHALAEIRTLVGAVLRQCPGIRMLATSRRRLGLLNEQVLPLGPLPAPTPQAEPERAELSAAVRLFIDRVHQVRPSFSLTREVLPVVIEICRRLDGLPLALELAATRAAVLGTGAVRDRLDHSLDLLGEDGQPRRSTLRAVVDWSYQLLTADERWLLAALSVFEGTFDLDAAEQVAQRSTPGPVAVGLARLVEASLVSAQLTSAQEATGETRYRMLAIVRAFAAERLTDLGDEREVRLAHARWVRSKVEDTSREATGPADAAAFTWLDQNRRNVAAAARWALRSDHPELAGWITGALGLCSHWRPDAELVALIGDVARHLMVRRTPATPLALGAGAFAATERGQLDDAEHLASEALAQATASTERYLALLALSVTALYRGQHDRSAAWWHEILTIEDLPAAFRSDGHASLALLASYRGDLATAHRHAAQARAAAEAAGATGHHAFAAYVSGELALLENPEAAIMVLRGAAAEAERAGATHVASVARIALFSALTRLDRRGEAADLVAPLLHDERRSGHWPQLWTTVRILAELFVAFDRPETAALLLAAAHAAPAAPPIAGEDVARYHKLDERIRHRIGADAVGRINELARILPRTQVIERALATIADLPH